MNDLIRFHRIAAVSILLAIPIAIASAILLSAAGFNLHAACPRCYN